MIYTVIGLYDNTGEVFYSHIEATDQHTAMAMAALNVGPTESDLQILCAIEGRHEIIAACEDSCKAAYIADLMPR